MECAVFDRGTLTSFYNTRLLLSQNSDPAEYKKSFHKAMEQGHRVAWPNRALVTGKFRSDTVTILGSLLPE